MDEDIVCNCVTTSPAQKCNNKATELNYTAVWHTSNGETVL